jgi:glucosamine 6-phosphate synthetase-like amidotransferase/phosphosugar isomerase protein
MEEILTIRQQQELEYAEIESRIAKLAKDIEKVVDKKNRIWKEANEFVHLVSNTPGLPNEIYDKALELNFVLIATI